jgi:hypothetical protein
MNAFLKYIDIVIAEAACVASLYTCRSAMQRMMYGMKSSSRIWRNFAKRPLWDRLFFFKVCWEYDRRKEKLFYCVANLVSYLVAIGELVYFCVQTFRGVAPDQRAVLVLPVALFFGINSSIPYLVPDFYGNERNIEKDKARDLAVLLFLVFGYCVFMT